MTPLDHALDLASEGYAVFPCLLCRDAQAGRACRRDAKGKRACACKKPSCSHGLSDAISTSDEGMEGAADRLRDLWRRHPGNLVGVATGAPSGVVVLDLDKGKPGIREWWQEHKLQLSPTRVHRTMSGGLHLLYTDPGGLRNSTSKIAPGVDVRATGGYAIWWPAAGLPVLSGAHAPAPWPQWLTRLLEPPPVPLPAPRRANLSNSPGARRARLEGLVKTVLTAPEGNRNACLFWAACTVRDIAAELEPGEQSEAIEALFLAGRTVGLPDIEIRRTLKSAERRVA